MKQGKASREGAYGRKVEPSANGINPGWTNMLGNMQGNHVTNRDHTNYRGEKMYQGRGFEAPKNKSQSHGCGSQGRH